MKNKVPRLKTDKEAEAFLAHDLSDLDFSQFKPARFEFEKKLEEGCWPRFLSGPSDGWLCEEECGELVSVLNECTDGNDCFFRFSEWLLYGQGKPLFFRGSLDELNEFRKTSGYKIGPEYWWPRSRNWCVCSDYDHTFTIVGGSKELISTLLTNDILECLEVTPLTRIDYFVPMP